MILLVCGSVVHREQVLLHCPHPIPQLITGGLVLLVLRLYIHSDDISVLAFDTKLAHRTAPRRRLASGACSSTTAAT